MVPAYDTELTSSLRMGNMLGEPGLLVPIPATGTQVLAFLCLSGFTSVRAYTHNPSSRETEAGGLSCVQGQPGLIRTNLTENKMAVRVMARGRNSCFACTWT